jgi:hypothetical protein
MGARSGQGATGILHRVRWVGALALAAGLTATLPAHAQPSVTESGAVTPPGRRWGGGLGSDFWLPLASSGERKSPSVLMGGHLWAFRQWGLSGTTELRAGLIAVLVASSRGVLLPLGAQIEPVFMPRPGVLTSISLGAGMLVPVTYEASAGEWKRAPSPYARAQISPFGFRFGPGDRGEMSLRFGLTTSRVESDTSTRWAVSFLTAGAWLAYAL